METTNNKANSKDACRYAAAKGFGYHASVFDRATDEQIVHFMYRLNQPAFNKMIRELGRGKMKLADYLKEEKDKNSGAFGRLAAISNAMTEDSGILFIYDFSDDSHSGAIIHPLQYPWQMNSLEQALQQDTLNELYIKYMRLLFAGDVPPEKLESFNLE